MNIIHKGRYLDMIWLYSQLFMSPSVYVPSPYTVPKPNLYTRTCVLGKLSRGMEKIECIYVIKRESLDWVT